MSTANFFTVAIVLLLFVTGVFTSYWSFRHKKPSFVAVLLGLSILAVTFGIVHSVILAGSSGYGSFLFVVMGATFEIASLVGISVGAIAGVTLRKSKGVEN